jgi:hypothetical protein
MLISAFFFGALGGGVVEVGKGKKKRDEHQAPILQLPE